MHAEAGTMHRKEQKPKLKFFPRRGHEPVDQSITENDKLTKSVSSGKGMCDVFAVCFSVSFFKATTQMYNSQVVNIVVTKTTTD